MYFERYVNSLNHEIHSMFTCETDIAKELDGFKKAARNTRNPALLQDRLVLAKVRYSDEHRSPAFKNNFQKSHSHMSLGDRFPAALSSSHQNAWKRTAVQRKKPYLRIFVWINQKKEKHSQTFASRQWSEKDTYNLFTIAKTKTVTINHGGTLL